MKSGPTVHLLGETVVFDENLNPVEPGSGVIGKIARSGDIPLGYYNDPKKTAEVFIKSAAPATSCRATTPPSRPTGPSPCSDAARSSSTRAARRSSPRRSSRPCARTPTSWTPSCAGRPTSAGARRWPPSSSPGSGTRRPSLESIQEHCRSTIAGYKLPRRLYVVDAVERSPSGKPDYTWAAAIVTADAGTDPSVPGVPGAAEETKSGQTPDEPDTRSPYSSTCVADRVTLRQSRGTFTLHSEGAAVPSGTSRAGCRRTHRRPEPASVRDRRDGADGSRSRGG